MGKINKKLSFGATEVAKQLWALAAFPEDWCLILITHVVVYNHLWFRPRVCNSLFWSLWTVGMHSLNRHICRQNTCRQKVFFLQERKTNEHFVSRFPLQSQLGHWTGATPRSGDQQRGRRLSKPDILISFLPMNNIMEKFLTSEKGTDCQGDTTLHENIQVYPGL